jgi:hypothetical protein
VGVGDLEEVKTELEKVEEYIRDIKRFLVETK